MVPRERSAKNAQVKYESATCYKAKKKIGRKRTTRILINNKMVSPKDRTLNQTFDGYFDGYEPVPYPSK